jgi:hypothetical protein
MAKNFNSRNSKQKKANAFMNLLFIYFIFLGSLLSHAAPLEVTAQSTPYPFIKSSEKLVLQLSGTQKTKFLNSQESPAQSFIVNSFFPISNKLTATFGINPQAQINMGLGVKILNEYEFSLYTPHVFFFANQSFPLKIGSSPLDSDTNYSNSIRVKSLRPITSIGFYTIKELNETDLFASTELRYHHSLVSQNAKTSEQVSIHADMGFNYYIPSTKFSIAPSTGVELRTQTDLDPYWNLTGKLTYLFSRTIQVNTLYRNESLLTMSNKNLDTENQVTFNLQYFLF